MKVVILCGGLGSRLAEETNGKFQCLCKSSVPNDLGPISSISTGFGANTCNVKTDGTAQCWALNSPATVPADLGIVSSIGAGYGYFCAVKTEGSIQCWGSDVSGESTVPTKLQ